MASNTSDQSLPRNIRGWKKLARIWNVSGGINQLGSPVPVRSASKFEFKQFLGLQVIYEFPKVRSRLPIQITKQFPSSGDSDLENLSGWNAYLGEVEKFDIHLVTQSSAAQTSVPRTLGSLVNVWQFQLHVLLGDEAAADPNKISEVTPVAHRTRAQTLKRDPYSTPNPTARFKDLPLVDRVSEMSLEDDNFEGEAEEGIEEEEDISDDGTAERLGTLSDNDDEADPEGSTANGDPNDGFYTPARDSTGRLIRDEQTVNVFLLTLLSAITATTVPFETRWLAERNAMIFQKEVRYVARTDGHLRNKRGPSFALIEVKPCKRSENVSIRVQESAQMAAWISHHTVKSHDPNKSCEIFLLSQDKDEIYVTFPRFSEAYGKNKNINDLKATHFLRMREYGPFRLWSKEDVNHIANFLHRYTLQKSKK